MATAVTMVVMMMMAMRRGRGEETGSTHGGARACTEIGERKRSRGASERRTLCLQVKVKVKHSPH